MRIVIEVGASATNQPPAEPSSGELHFCLQLLQSPYSGRHHWTVSSSASRTATMATLILLVLSTILVSSTYGSPVAQALDKATFVEPTHCPEQFGLQLYPHPTHCDHFFKCANGTITHEICPNGLLFDGHGSVAHYCNYEWAVDCKNRKERAPPISTPHCLYLWGIYPIDNNCNTHYHKCADGQALATPCDPGLVYDDRIHSCNWPDQLKNCNSDAVIGFSCPKHATGLSARFVPHPRYSYPHDCNRYIVCVEHKPRLIGCGDGAGFDPDTLTCVDLKEKRIC